VGEAGDEGVPVDVIPEQGAPLQAPADQVLQHAGRVEAGLAGHGPQPPPADGRGRAESHNFITALASRLHSAIGTLATERPFVLTAS
jgi:hypothetical protein